MVHGCTVTDRSPQVVRRDKDVMAANQNFSYLPDETINSSVDALLAAD